MHTRKYRELLAKHRKLNESFYDSLEILLDDYDKLHEQNRNKEMDRQDEKTKSSKQDDAETGRKQKDGYKNRV